MLGRWLFGAQKLPKGPDGYRAYGVGDVHGRADLLRPLLDRIAENNEKRGAAKVYIIFLGDLIDRGPDSAGVLDLLRAYSPAGMEPVFLGGNHEEVFLQAINGDEQILGRWLRFGGAEFAASYGINPELLQALPAAEGIEKLRAAIPAEHLAFVEGFADTFRFGDYLFVHAGMRPGIALEKQNPTDLRWIREPFLSDRRNHGVIVVHGHTVADRVIELPNRIGIDTGAYRTGVLTALGIEGEERWLIQQSDMDLPERAEWR